MFNPRVLATRAPGPLFGLRSTEPVLTPAAARRVAAAAYVDVFAWRVAGVPCLIAVTRLDVVPGDLGADNPDDYYGYSELEYTVLDRRASPAPWLASKLTMGDDLVIRVEAFRRHNYN